MFHTKMRGGRAFAGEQKIGQFRKILLRSKRFEKNSDKILRPNDLINKADQNMNQTIPTEYQLAPETIEKRSLDLNDATHFQEIYNFMRI